jgi:hypothetical protein
MDGRCTIDFHEPMDVRLHYSTAKLGRLGASALFLVGSFAWIALDASVVEESDGPIGRIARAFGPDAVRLGFLALAVAVAILALGYLRLIVSSESLALGADRENVTVRSVFGTKVYPWRNVETLFIRSVRTRFREHRLIMLRTGRGRSASVAWNALRETEDEVEAWLMTAEGLRLAAIDSR